MALSIAIVPNLLQLTVRASGEGSQDTKLALIGCMAVGATIGGAFLARVVQRVRPRSTSPDAPTWQLPALAAFGVLASCYFIAVVGLGRTSGFGPGIAETIDSGLAPCIYIAVFYGSALWARHDRPAARPTARSIWGAALVLVGLGGVGLTITLHDGNLAWVFEDSLLACFALAGAAGTAFSLWLARRLVKMHEIPVGRVVAWRYGGVAMVFLFASMLVPCSSSVGLFWAPALVMLLGGGVLITGAVYFATQIENDHAVAAGLGLTPLLALGLELAIHASGLGESRFPIDSLWLWASVGTATAGIITLHNEPSANAIWPSARG